MKRIQKRGYDPELMLSVVEILANGEKLAPKYEDHLLSGDYGGYRECT